MWDGDIAWREQLIHKIKGQATRLEVLTSCVSLTVAAFAVACRLFEIVAALQDMNNLVCPPPEAFRGHKDDVKRDEKRSQRRTPWACDECRLRKRKCDGVEPCSPCQRSGLGA